MRDTSKRDLRRADVGDAPVTVSSPAPSVWWVNRGATYAQEREPECLWAPKQGRRGQSVPHHTNTVSVKAGDVISV